MFRPSQALLLRFTSSFGKLHQPLPLNPRQCRELLGLLTTSFRTHLDKEHGPVVGDSEAHKPTGQSPLPSRGHGVDQHMQSLFLNPLLKSPPVQREDAPGPMDIFERAVANGMMNTDMAAACLYREKNNILASTTVGVRDGMKQSGAGRKVLRWLTSSGTVHVGPNWMCDKFCGILMRFLVAEGLQEAAWDLIKTALDPGRPLRKMISVPIYHLIRAEAYSADGIDIAYLRMEEAFSRLQQLPRHMQEAILMRAMRFLVQNTISGISGGDATRNGVARIGRPRSEKVFESFLDLLSRHPGALCIFPFHLKHLQFADLPLAHLHLAHPTRPSSQLALKTLHRQWHLEPNSTAGLRMNPQAIIRLALDTTKFLLDNNRLGEADWVMQYLRCNFPKELGEHQHKRLDNEAAEASSLEMLDHISLA